MSLLTPGGLLGLSALGVLLWLWRLASARREYRIASLIPFERLLQRPPRRRAHVIVNALFWLQAAAIAGLALALAQPIIRRRPASTALVIVDTSASMGSRRSGATAFERARRALLVRAAAKSPTEQWLIVTTAPSAAVTSEPTSDPLVLSKAVQAAHVADLGGDLAAAARIGLAMLSAAPDRILVATDEPKPELPAAPRAVRTEWIGVGERATNVALVGVESRGPLCRASEARVVATVRNFSDELAQVTVTAQQSGHQLTAVHAELLPGAQQSLSLALPESAQGWIQVTLAGAGDSLAIDDSAWVEPRHLRTLPILLQVDDPGIQATVASWLSACEALVVTTNPESAGAAVRITDRSDHIAAAAELQIIPPAHPTPIRARWLIATDHPIGAYLAPVETVTAPVNLSAGERAGIPVAWVLMNGRKIPMLVAHDTAVRRVELYVSLAEPATSTPLILLFFNSVRWLVGESQPPTTGTPVVVNGFADGSVQVKRPDERIEEAVAAHGAVSYEPDQAGVYEFRQGSTAHVLAANFFNPLESNLLAPVSTWRPVDPAMMPSHVRQPAQEPLAHRLIVLMTGVLLMEWAWYTRRERLRGHRAPPIVQQGLQIPVDTAAAHVTEPVTR